MTSSRDQRDGTDEYAYGVAPDDGLRAEAHGILPRRGAGRASPPLALASLVALACGGVGCPASPSPEPGTPPAPPGTPGVADGLRAIAAERHAALAPYRCAAVDASRVVICEADISASELATLRSALALAPLGQTQAPGPPFGKSRCLDAAPAGALALVTGFPWIDRSHFRYLLVVVPPGGGHACVETEEGYG